MSLDLFMPAARRRSVRVFEDRPMLREHIELILEAGRRAPSAVNLQPTRVLVANSVPHLATVRSAAYGIGACATAPCVLVCMADLTADERLPERMAELVADGAIQPRDTETLRSGAGRPFELKTGSDIARLNCAVATAHMDLQATALGLGTCWVHHVDVVQLRDELGIPEHLEIVTLLAIGHPDEHPSPRPRIDSIEWRAVQDA